MSIRKGQILVVLKTVLFVSCVTFAWFSSAAWEDLKAELGFQSGIYNMVKGESPCAESFVGWMDGEPSPSFMLGQNIVFANINEGSVEKRKTHSDECSYKSNTVLKKNRLAQTTDIDCPGGQISRSEVLTVSGGTIDYQLEISSGGKLNKQVRCVYKVK